MTLGSELVLLASLLIVVLVTRAASQRVPRDIMAFAASGTVATALAPVALLAAGIDIEYHVFYFGLAAFAGVLWTAAMTKGNAYSSAHPLRDRVVGAVLAILLVGALFVPMALYYVWYIVPVLIMAAIGLGIAGNAFPKAFGLTPRAGGAAAVSAAPAAAVAAPAQGAPGPISPARPAPSLAAPAAPPGAAPARPALRSGGNGPWPSTVEVNCTVCFLRGTVPAAGPGVIPCPRCKSPVRKWAQPPGSR